MTGLTIQRLDTSFVTLLLRLGVLPLIVALGATASLQAQQHPAGTEQQETGTFTQDFLPRTMRVDYFHTGNVTDEHVALDRILADGPWAGSRRHLVDTLNLGLYRFEVRDGTTNRLLFARGFCSVFGEWQTTNPAKQRWGTFHESLRFPWPKQTVKVVLQRRAEGDWHDLWTQEIDPASRFVTNADTPRRDEVWTVFSHGDPSEKVDIVFLGDGYTRDEMPKFHEAVRRLTEPLFSVEPFKSRRQDFNVRAIDAVAAESGVSRPRKSIFHRSPFGCEYNTFDLPRYVLTFDNRSVRDAAAQAPYDFLVILLNERTYGGGGIYNDQTTVVADNSFSSYILIHEFGHHMAGLGDEYYTSDVAYETGQPIKIEPWEPNITALLDAAQLKWKDLVEPDVPLPTPWDKVVFEAQRKKSPAAQGEQRPAEGIPSDPANTVQNDRERMTRILRENQYYGKVGAFEGAAYESKGLYRPAIDCVMFSRNTVEFCPVCQIAIERVIDTHVK